MLIPVFNEANTLEQLLKMVVNIQLPDSIQKEIILVDDGSTDDTPEVAKHFITSHASANISLISLPKNKGKGAAIRAGLEKVSGEYLLIQDADLEYNPQDYPTLLKPVLDAQADVVYGSRFVGNSPHRVLFFWHYVGNRILTLLSNLFSDLNLTDMETGYKLIRTDILKKLPLKENRFGFEPEVTVKLARVPEIRFYEVGISYYGRTYKEGKKVGTKDGFRAIYCLFKYGLLKMN